MAEGGEESTGLALKVHSQNKIGMEATEEQETFQQGVIQGASGLKREELTVKLGGG